MRIVRGTVAWLREHTLTVLVAFGVYLATATIAPAVVAVDENRADLKLICTKVNKAVEFIDEIVAYSLRNINDPVPTVSDPAVQKLIEKGRAQAHELRDFSENQSKEARCHVD